MALTSIKWGYKQNKGVPYWFIGVKEEVGEETVINVATTLKYTFEWEPDTAVYALPNPSGCYLLGAYRNVTNTEYNELGQ